MEQIKLAFKNDRKLTKEEERVCRNIISIIYSHKRIPGGTIALLTGISPAAIRHYIKLIRENNDFFFKGSYLIAHTKGYTITNVKRELKSYHNKLQGMTHSKVKQLYQLEEVLGGK